MRAEEAMANNHYPFAAAFIPDHHRRRIARDPHRICETHPARRHTDPRLRADARERLKRLNGSVAAIRANSSGHLCERNHALP
jgi:hypothetical protein